VRLLLRLELLLVLRLLLLELLLKLRVGLLEFLQIILEQPGLSGSFVLQHVQLSLQITILDNLLGDALVQGSYFPRVAHDRAEFLRLLLGFGDYMLRKRGRMSPKQFTTTHNGNITRVLPWRSCTAP
jgi:hypothetical protein